MENPKPGKNLKLTFFLKWSLVFLLALAAGITLRLQPLTNNLGKRQLALARTILRQNLEKKVNQQIEKNFPGLPLETKTQMARQRVEMIIKNEAEQFEKTAKSMVDIPTDFHLLGADPFYFYYLTENIKNSGNLSEKMKNGKYFDPLMMAPQGHWRKIEAHPYLGFAFYRFLSIFNPGLSLYQATAWLPIVLFIPIVFIFLWICFLLGITKVAALSACLFFVLSPIFIQRSAIGWYDTDPYNVLFPLLMVLLLIKLKQGRANHLYLTGLALSTALFSLFWQGWLMLLAFIAVYFIFDLLPSPKRQKKLKLKQIIFYLLTTSFFAALFLTPAGLKASLTETLTIAFGFLSPEAVIWPNIFITVGELRPLGFRRFAHILGGYLFVFFAFSGLFLAWFSPSKRKKPFKIIILAYFVFFFFVGISASRFLIFFIGPAAIAAAYFFLYLYRFIKHRLDKFPFSRRFSGFIANTIILGLGSSAFIYGTVSATNLQPVYNQVWEKALLEIKEKTPPESIINTWWPPGHFIKAISKRRVSFDGATLETQPSYWMARFFMANDEQKAVGILRMLNSSGTKAIDFLKSNGFTVEKIINFLEKILPLEKEEAGQVIAKSFDPKKTELLLSLTHGRPPPTYCLVYKDLVDGIIGTYYLSNWDFEKAFYLAKARQEAPLLRRLFWRGSKEHIRSMWQVSGGMPFVSGQSFLERKENDVAYFQNGIKVNTATMEARIIQLENRISGIPQKIIYNKAGKIREKSLENSNLNLGLLLTMPPEAELSVIAAPEPILKSIIFNLFYLDGAGLENFTKIIETQDPRLNKRILVYQVSF